MPKSTPHQIAMRRARRLANADDQCARAIKRADERREARCDEAQHARMIAREIIEREYSDEMATIGAVPDVQ